MSEVSLPIEATNLTSVPAVTPEPAVPAAVDNSLSPAHSETSPASLNEVELAHTGDDNSSQVAQQFSAEDARVMMQKKLQAGEITQAEHDGALSEIKKIEDQIAAQSGTTKQARTPSTVVSAASADTNPTKPKFDLRSKVVAVLDKLPGIIRVPILLIADIINIPLQIVRKIASFNPMKPLPKLK